MWLGPLITSFPGFDKRDIDKIFTNARTTPAEVMAEAVELLSTCEVCRVSNATMLRALEGMVGKRLTGAERIELAGMMLDPTVHAAPERRQAMLEALFRDSTTRPDRMEGLARGKLLGTPCSNALERSVRVTGFQAYARVFSPFGQAVLARKVLTHPDNPQQTDLAQARELRCMALDAMKVPVRSPELIKEMDDHLGRLKPPGARSGAPTDADRRLLELSSLAYARPPRERSSAAQLRESIGSLRKDVTALLAGRSSPATQARLIAYLDTVAALRQQYSAVYPDEAPIPPQTVAEQRKDVDPEFLALIQARTAPGPGAAARPPGPDGRALPPSPPPDPAQSGGAVASSSASSMSPATPSAPGPTVAVHRESVSYAGRDLSVPDGTD